MRDMMLCWQTGFSSLFFFASLCLTVSRVWSRSTESTSERYVLAVTMDAWNARSHHDLSQS